MEIRKGTARELDELAALYNAVCDALAAGTNYPGWRRGIDASHLCYTWPPSRQCQATVKVHGVFPSFRRHPAFSPELQLHRDPR